MAHIIHELRKLRHKARKQAPQRGRLPEVGLRPTEIIFVSPWAFAVATLVGPLASVLEKGLRIFFHRVSHIECVRLSASACDMALTKRCLTTRCLC